MSTKAAATAAPAADRDVQPETPAGVLAAARAERKAADAAEARLLALGVEWALMNPADPIHPTDPPEVDPAEVDRGREPATYTWRSWAGIEDTGLTLAGDGAPAVAEYAVPEFAAAVGLSTDAGKSYLGQALELCYRLPRHWKRVTTGDLPAWRARRVADRTQSQTREAAA
jgi:hypothetical protein